MPIDHPAVIAALYDAIKSLVTEIRAYSWPECDDEGAIGAAELKACDDAVKLTDAYVAQALALNRADPLALGRIQILNEAAAKPVETPADLVVPLSSLPPANRKPPKRCYVRRKPRTLLP